MSYVIRQDTTYDFSRGDHQNAPEVPVWQVFRQLSNMGWQIAQYRTQAAAELCVAYLTGLSDQEIS